jgi:hypothetical protein
MSNYYYEVGIEERKIIFESEVDCNGNERNIINLARKLNLVDEFEYVDYGIEITEDEYKS